MPFTQRVNIEFTALTDIVNQTAVSAQAGSAAFFNLTTKPKGANNYE